MLVKAWEDTFVNRPKPDEKLIQKYGSLYGAVLHATKYRPEILAAMGLLGSCLTFPTEKLYYCLVRVLEYLVRTKNLGITYLAYAPNALQAVCTRRLELVRAAVDYRLRRLPRRRGYQPALAPAALHHHVVHRG